jgi:exoribonuclease II
MQVKDLEDELIRSTDVKRIKDLIGCRSDSDFKRDFLKEKRLIAKLREHSFDIDKMWVTTPSEEYTEFQSAGERIKTAHM